MVHSSEETWGFRMQPREWPRLFRRIREDPYDVEVGTRVFFSLGGHDEEPTYRRLLATATGEKLVREGTDYPPLFTDYDALRALPEGTLGRQYVRELDERGIHPAELERLTSAAHAGRAFTREHAWVRDRVRNAHDLYHTLTGYGIDIVGECGVLAFTFGQTGNKGWAMLVLLNMLTQLGKLRLDGWLVAWRGYRHGRRSRFLAERDDWDRLLRLPLEEARAELGIPTLAPYRPLAMEDVFGLPAGSPG